MANLLARSWHHPIAGPVMLIAVGLPVFVGAIVLLAIVPVFGLIDAARAVLTASALRMPAALAVASLLAWGLVLGYGLIARRTATGLPVREVTIPGASALSLCTELRDRLDVALSGQSEVAGLELSPVIEEDYGAGLWLSRGRDTFWLALSDAGAGEVISSLTYDPGLDLWRRLVHRPDADLHAALWSTNDAELAALTRRT
jgi:hypothetical protein